MKVYEVSNIGKRNKNQDQVAIVLKDKRQMIAIVCDGMGGHNSGELASKIVIDYISDCFRLMPQFKNVDEARKWLVNAIKDANSVTFKQASLSANHTGMGTTVVAALIYDNTVLIVNVGDSRCYMITDNMKQVTTDDTFVNELIKTGVITKEEGEHHPKRNVLMKAVGVDATLDFTIDEISLQEGYLLLCSDGLHGAVPNEVIMNVVLSKDTLKNKCNRLINMSLTNGGTDNISIALIQIERGDINDK